MSRLSLPRRLVLQVVIVVSLVVAMDNVRVPAGVEAASGGQGNSSRPTESSVPTVTAPPETSVAAPFVPTTVTEQGRTDNSGNGRQGNGLADEGTNPANGGTNPANLGTNPANLGTNPANGGTSPANGGNGSEVEERGNEEHANCGGGNGTEIGPVGNGSGNGGCGGAPETTTPETTTPETTTPETTAPETTTPETTTPETTTPETTTPETTTPETTTPETTTPETTTPETTTPETTTPETTTPAGVGTNPGGSTNVEPATETPAVENSPAAETPAAEQPVVTVVLAPSTPTAEPAALPASPPPVTNPPVTFADGSTELRAERTDTFDYVVRAIPPAAMLGLVDLELRLADRVDQRAVDLGYVSVRLEATDVFGRQVDKFSMPVSIRMQSLPSDGVVAISSDDVQWTPIPRLSSFSLPVDQTVGYFVDVDGSVVVVTKQPLLVGIRKQRPALRIEDVRSEMTPGSATKLSVAGQIGDEPVVLSVRGAESTCVVSNTGVLRALDGGSCSISAVQGGGSMYMSATAEEVTSNVRFIEQLREAIVRYRTSIAMLILVLFLALFLAWELGQTVVDVRRALRTDPEAL